jgi:hypothetical protein
MEVLLVNLSLKRLFLKPESSETLNPGPPNSGPGSTRWQLAPPIVFPVSLLDSSSLLLTSLGS